jgi:predicted Zn-dependent protease
MSHPSTPDPEVSSSRRAFIISGASSVVPTMAPARAESAASVDTLQRSLVAAYEVQDFTAALDALRQLRQLEPEELRWIEADATISTDRKDFTRALKAYDAAYELARGDAGAEARILNGRALAREGIYDWPIRPHRLRRGAEASGD